MPPADAVSHSVADEEYSVRRSVEAILRNQHDNGAIIASPDFAQYRFCWLRDGSFSAYALDIAGEREASARYHAWVGRAVNGIAATMEDAIAARQAGEGLDPLHMPPARFAVDGTTVVDGWPNFQIDGYGTWLWFLGRHVELSRRGGLPEHLLEPVRRVARYLTAFSMSPCYDVWEENGDAQHTSTLACVYGGLTAAARLLGDEEYVAVASDVRACVLERASQVGYFVKSSGNPDVDASCLWLASPFGLVDSNDEYFAKTVSLIKDRLSFAGGIRRYPTDVYFGSGAWPVLTASLGWHYMGLGDLDGAEGCRSWIASHVDDAGLLAEQYDGALRDNEHYRQWVRRWGPPAKDLTWSHAMYVVLCDAIERARSSSTDHGERSRDSIGELEAGFEASGASGID